MPSLSNYVNRYKQAIKAQSLYCLLLCLLLSSGCSNQPEVPEVSGLLDTLAALQTNQYQQAIEQDQTALNQLIQSQRHWQQQLAQQRLQKNQTHTEIQQLEKQLQWLEQQNRVQQQRTTELLKQQQQLQQQRQHVKHALAKAHQQLRNNALKQRQEHARIDTLTHQRDELRQQLEALLRQSLNTSH